MRRFVSLLSVALLLSVGISIAPVELKPAVLSASVDTNQSVFTADQTARSSHRLGRGLHIHGTLHAVQYRPTIIGGCDSETTKFTALHTMRLAKQAMLAGQLQQIPRSVSFVPCLAITERFAPNLIVNAGETALRDCFIGTCTVASAFKFHALGTDATAVAETQTALVAELTTQYNPNSTRATGSQTNNGANVYRTVGTNTVDAAAVIVEYAILDNATTGSGTMWTRLTFASISLASGDSLAGTYDLQIE